MEASSEGQQRQAKASKGQKLKEVALGNSAWKEALMMRMVADADADAADNVNGKKEPNRCNCCCALKDERTSSLRDLHFGAQKLFTFYICRISPKRRILANLCTWHNTMPFHQAKGF
jgi:hypothetical protein